MRIKLYFLVVCAFSLVGCVSETRSLVSSQDIPASKYKKVILFVENLDGMERPAAEQILVTTLRDAGVEAVSSSEAFKSEKSLDATAQGALIRRQGFDAALYVTVLEKGVVEEQVEGAWFDLANNEMHIDPVGGITATLRGYVVKPDGSVYYSNWTMKTKSELQDVQSAKQVWISETVAVGHGQFSNMSLIFAQAAKQIVQKMRGDNAI